MGGRGVGEGGGHALGGELASGGDVASKLAEMWGQQVRRFMVCGLGSGFRVWGQRVRPFTCLTSTAVQILTHEELRCGGAINFLFTGVRESVGHANTGTKYTTTATKHTNAAATKRTNSGICATRRNRGLCATRRQAFCGGLRERERRCAVICVSRSLYVRLQVSVQVSLSFAGLLRRYLR
jgi:hypothetical protein